MDPHPDYWYCCSDCYSIHKEREVPVCDNCRCRYCSKCTVWHHEGYKRRVDLENVRRANAARTEAKTAIHGALISTPVIPDLVNIICEYALAKEKTAKTVYEDDGLHCSGCWEAIDGPEYVGTYDILRHVLDKFHVSMKEMEDEALAKKISDRKIELAWAPDADPKIIGQKRKADDID